VVRAKNAERSHNWHDLVTHVRARESYSDSMDSSQRAWTDERMDEFAARTEENFKEVRTEIREVRSEMNGRFAKLESTFNRRFDILFGALATGFVGAVVSHFLG
jgi:hypothetical protein